MTAGPGDGPVEATRRFRAVAGTAVEELLDLEPERATALGDHRGDDRLDDLSEAGLADRRARLRDAVDAVDSLDLDGLDPEDAVDAELLRTALDRRLLDLDVVRRLTWDPLAWLPTDALHLLLARDTQPAADRLHALAGRLEAVPERLALARRSPSTPPRSRCRPRPPTGTRGSAPLSSPPRCTSPWTRSCRRSRSSPGRARTSTR